MSTIDDEKKRKAKLAAPTDPPPAAPEPKVDSGGPNERRHGFAPKEED